MNNRPGKFTDFTSTLEGWSLMNNVLIVAVAENCRNRQFPFKKVKSTVAGPKKFLNKQLCNCGKKD